MTPVQANSRKVGDNIDVYDNFLKDATAYTGVISNITKKFVTVRHPLGSNNRFHRATGYIVGYRYPTYMHAIAPETNKNT